jgi:hypothetical protein
MKKPWKTSASLDAFTARLQNLDGDVRRAVQRAIREETKQTTDEIREACPVGPTGLLKKSVTMEISGDGMTGFAKAGGAKAPHAHLVEFGHRQVNVAGTQTGTVPGHPFVTPAGERGRARLAPRLAAILKENIK